MKHLLPALLSAVLLLGLCGVAPVAAQEDPAMNRLQALGVALQTRSTWSASYTQEYVSAGMTLGEIVHGEVWVSWPDKALFATGEPVIRWMGLAGRQVRLLDLESLTCDDHLLTPEEWERIPLVAVLEPRRAVAQFTVLAEGESGIVLLPREPGGVSRVEIAVAEDGLPGRIVVKDPQGSVNTFDFTDWNAADGPPEGSWLPNPPEGMECVSDS